MNAAEECSILDFLGRCVNAGPYQERLHLAPLIPECESDHFIVRA
jgi:hypothetical protein